MRFIAVILTFLCLACGVRTSSEQRFEDNIGFALPNDKKVLKDEFHDMLQKSVSGAVMFETRKAKLK